MIKENLLELRNLKDTILFALRPICFSNPTAVSIVKGVLEVFLVTKILY